MEKYYREDVSGLRSQKNEKLYREVSREISDLDNLPIPDNSNEIDINGLREIITSRDEYRKTKNLRHDYEEKSPPLEEEEKPKKESRIYDINVLLENAKQEVDRSNSVSNKLISKTFLTNLEDADIPDNSDAVELATPLNNEEKRKSNTDSLPLDILMDLKGNDNTVVTDPIVKDEVTMIRKLKEGETFYSGSFNFTKKDFDNDDDEDDEKFIEEDNHMGLKVFFLVVGIIVLVVVLYLIITTYIL